MRVASIAGSVLLAGLLPAMPVVAQVSAPAASAPVAIIGSEQITFQQLPAKAGSDLGDLAQRHEQQMRTLELEYNRSRQALLEREAQDYLDQQLLQREAQARNLTPDQLLAQLKPREISEAEVSALYEQHRAQINQPLEAVRPLLLQRLQQQASADARHAYLEELRGKYAARLTLEPLREPVATSGASRGPSSAAVTIVEFADFQCPYCRQMEPILQQVLAHYPHDVRLVYRHLPLSEIHANAMHAAVASVCAQQQGKFWEMHDALFADPHGLDPDNLRKTAARLHLDGRKFDACTVGVDAVAVVKADEQAGVNAGVDGTPGLFINGRFFNGAMSYDHLAAVVDDELWRHKTVVAAR
jgi:protein-disulfide isomerase